MSYDIKKLKEEADRGEVSAMYNYALMLDKDDKNPNKEEAAEYYKKAIEKGNITAMYNYAVMLDEGNGIPVNKKEAAKYYKMAANKGNIKAMNNYAAMLKDGDGIPMNTLEAVKYFKKAIEKNNVDAMYNYAAMLKDGDGIPMNTLEAAKYFKKAADLGDIDSKKEYFSLGDDVLILFKQKDKLKNDLDLLQKTREKTTDEEQNYLDNLTNEKELSSKCKNCLYNLSLCFKEKKINLNNMWFKETLEEIRESGNKQEYLLICSKLLEVTELNLKYDSFKLEDRKKELENKQKELKNNKEYKKAKKEIINMQKKINNKQKKLMNFKENTKLIAKNYNKSYKLFGAIRKRIERRKAKKELNKILDITENLSLLEKGTEEYIKY